MEKTSPLIDFEKYLSIGSSSISITDSIINLIISGVLSLLLVKTYMICATSISNRKNLSKNFIMLTLTTVFIITIVKSSLALSLGLVGALSIIRFRTAIKEPEELLYFFLCIAIGLGLGANQKIITIVSFFSIIIFIWSRYFLINEKEDKSQNLVLTISYDKKLKISFENILAILEDHSNFLKMIRIDDSSSNFEATFNIEFENFKQINLLRESLNTNFQNLELTIIDNSNLI